MVNMEATRACFHSVRGALRCEGIPLAALARRHGTPLWVMSAAGMRSALRQLREAFGEFNPLVCFAVKANHSIGVIRLLAREGCGAEVVSAGELYRALRAGVPASRIVFSGAGKTEAELEAGLRAGILMFNVESAWELRALSALARRGGRRARVAIRVNPGVDPHTHRFITTGTHENKFGIDIALAPRVFAEAARLPGIDLAGVHTHIGSQITDPAPFVESARRVNVLLGRLARSGISPCWRNLGGGLGVSYRPGGTRIDATRLARALAPCIRRGPPRLILEPGRYLAGEAGALLTKVIHVKRGVRKTFAVVDAAMTDLIRPSLYEAYHEIVPVAPRRGGMRKVDVVGPVCESSDFLGLRRRLPRLAAGDLLAVLGAGAYGSSMSSNYNGRRRAAEVLVDGRGARLIRRRERFPDLVAGEKA